MADVADLAGDIEQAHRDRALAAQRDESARMARIEEAMFSRGDRTTCRDCGEQIEPGRLRALSHASRCADCARIAERRLRGSTCKM